MSTHTVRLHRDGRGGYYADTPTGRVEIRPVDTDEGREGWVISREDGREIGSMCRTLADARRFLSH